MLILAILTLIHAEETMAQTPEYVAGNPLFPEQVFEKVPGSIQGPDLAVLGKVPNLAPATVPEQLSRDSIKQDHGSPSNLPMGRAVEADESAVNTSPRIHPATQTSLNTAVEPKHPIQGENESNLSINSKVNVLIPQNNFLNKLSSKTHDRQLQVTNLVSISIPGLASSEIRELIPVLSEKNNDGGQAKEIQPKINVDGTGEKNIPNISTHPVNTPSNPKINGATEPNIPTITSLNEGQEKVKNLGLITLSDPVSKTNEAEATSPQLEQLTEHQFYVGNTTQQTPNQTVTEIPLVKHSNIGHVTEREIILPQLNQSADLSSLPSFSDFFEESESSSSSEPTLMTKNMDMDANGGTSNENVVFYPQYVKNIPHAFLNGSNSEMKRNPVEEKDLLSDQVTTAAVPNYNRTFPESRMGVRSITDEIDNSLIDPNTNGFNPKTVESVTSDDKSSNSSYGLKSKSIVQEGFPNQTAALLASNNESNSNMSGNTSQHNGNNKKINIGAAREENLGINANNSGLNAIIDSSAKSPDDDVLPFRDSLENFTFAGEYYAEADEDSKDAVEEIFSTKWSNTPEYSVVDVVSYDDEGNRVNESTVDPGAAQIGTSEHLTTDSQSGPSENNTTSSSMASMLLSGNQTNSPPVNNDGTSNSSYPQPSIIPEVSNIPPDNIESNQSNSSLLVPGNVPNTADYKNQPEKMTHKMERIAQPAFIQPEKKQVSKRGKLLDTKKMNETVGAKNSNRTVSHLDSKTRNVPRRHDAIVGRMQNRQN